MLFIGHFSFDEIGQGGQPKHGYFSCVVDADSPEAASAKFEDHIKKSKETVEAMAGLRAVYIEDIVRIAKIPETPIMTRLQSADGPFPASISHSLPGVFGNDVEAFGYAPDVADHETLTDGSFIEAKPFITFES